MKDLLNDPKFSEAIRFYVMACASSRRHSALTKEALDKYGRHGSQISGVIRDHFPEDVKQTLRELAKNVTFYSDQAWKARPKYVRDDTMRKLSRLVAKRDGSGFYGPQG